MTATDSAAEVVADSADSAVEATSDPHEHPSDWAYVKIAAILAAITALEVSTYFVSVGDALIPSLMVMMVVKFWLVITWFMHLRFDGKIFKRLFLMGLFLAATVYLITLTVFGFWS